ncbi:MAG: HAD-IA family hydrolase [Bacteroidia bacterium]|nr:HAD-IA family hydrolase [Bacteroidia bacterium]
MEKLVPLTSDCMRYDLLVFDLDGTLVDSFADIHSSINELLRECGGRELPECTVRDGIGRGVRHLVRSCLAAAGLTACDLEDCLSTYGEIYQRNCLGRTELYAGVSATLPAFAPVPLAVVSNKPEHACRAILRGLGVEDYFVRIAGGDSYPELKPSPLPLLRIAMELGVAVDRVLMVGDSVYDLAAAHAAGCHACAVTWGFQDAETLKALNPEYMVSAFEDILGIAGRAATSPVS